MAKFDLKAYARQGAEARVAELNNELAAIYRAFPDLRSGRAGTTARGRKRATRVAAAPRRGRTMTAAQRKEVSLRMKRYWANKRKAKA